MWMWGGGGGHRRMGTLWLGGGGGVDCPKFYTDNRRGYRIS